MHFEESGEEWKICLQKTKEYFAQGDKDNTIINAAFCFYFQNQELKGLKDHFEFGSAEYSQAIANYVDNVIDEFDNQHPTAKT